MSEQTNTTQQNEHIPQETLILGHFSKSTIALILILTLITGGLLYLAVQSSQLPTIPTLRHTTAKASLAHTIVSLTQNATASQAGSLDVAIDSGTNKVSGVQIELAYDPSVLSNVAVSQGTFFDKPIVLLNNVVNTDPTRFGRISYAIAIQPNGTPVKGKGTVATISYTLKPTDKKTTIITFLPKTQVTQLGTMQSVLLKSIDLTITLPAATPSGR